MIISRKILFSFCSLLLTGAVFVGCSESDEKKSATGIVISGDETVVVGEQISLIATVTPNDAEDSVSWTVSNANAEIAGANKTAVLTGKNKGSVIVTATAGGASATKKITVTDVGGSDSTGIDYENHSAETNYLLKIRNNTSKKLVAFKGSPAADTLIGGIPASTSNHCLARASSLFPTSQDFILFIVTEEDYLANKDSLTSLANIPFARLYAYYNTNSNNNFVYEISGKMGGNAQILLNNNTPYNVELRKDGIYGETIGYTSARTINTTFKVESGDYYIFPVFRKFDTTLNEIVTVYPKYTTGNATGNAIVEYFNVNDQNPAQLDAANWQQGVTFTSGYAYIRINNQSSTGINFYNSANGVALTTSTGGQAINSGKSQVFTLAMDLNSSNSSTGDYKYESSKSYAQFRVGNSLKNDYYITGSSDTPYTYEAGKIYTYTVTGSTIYDLIVNTTPTVSDIGEF